MNKQLLLESIKHFASTAEIPDALIPYFNQHGRWVGDCRNWTKPIYRIASSAMRQAVLPGTRRAATNARGEPVLLTSFHWKKRRDLEIPWFEVGGSIKVRSLEAIIATNLRSVGGYVHSCTDAEARFPKLVGVGGDFDFRGTLRLHVPLLANVGGSVMALNCDLSNLETVGNRFAGYWNGPLHLPGLRSVGGSFVVGGGGSVIAPSLERVGSDLILPHKTVFVAKKLVAVGGSLDARSATTLRVAALRTVGETLDTSAALDFYRPYFEDLASWSPHPDAERYWDAKNAVTRCMRGIRPISI